MQGAISIAFQTDKPVPAYGPLGEFVETSGFDAVSVYNDLYYQPAWPALFEIARHTSRITLGPAAVSPFLAHPITIAGHIALLDEVAEGRAYLGLARGGWLDHLNISPAKPVTGLKEAFACIRHLLAQDVAALPGTIFPLAGGEQLRWPIRRASIPFLLGSWGPKSIEACIDAIAEVKVGGTANPAMARHMQGVIAQARERGQATNSVALVVGAVTVVDEDRQVARALARREVALYLPIVARLDPTLNLDPEWLARFEVATTSHHMDQATGLISDDLLSKFAFAGTPGDIIGQAAGLLAAGAHRIEFGTPHGVTAEGGVRLLASQVLPALRELAQ